MLCEFYFSPPIIIFVQISIIFIVCNYNQVLELSLHYEKSFSVNFLNLLLFGPVGTIYPEEFFLIFFVLKFTPICNMHTQLS